jgi:hypothetical protein
MRYLLMKNNKKSDSTYLIIVLNLCKIQLNIIQINQFIRKIIWMNLNKLFIYFGKN